MFAQRKLLTNEMVSVYESDSSEKIVDARDLHGFLNVASKFADWIKNRIEKYGFVEGEDFQTVSKILESGGRTIDYILKLDMAKELAMVENNEQGRMARKYFIEIEKRFSGQVPTAPMQPTPFAEFDQVTKLLQMLRMGERENLFNEATDRAIRVQVAEMMLGQSLPVKPDESKTAERPKDERPQWVKDGYGAKVIGLMVGCHHVKVGMVAKKNGLQTPEYGDWYEYHSKGKQHRIFIYNEAGKNRLLDLLSEQAANSKGTGR